MIDPNDPLAQTKQNMLTLAGALMLGKEITGGVDQETGLLIISTAGLEFHLNRPAVEAWLEGIRLEGGWDDVLVGHLEASLAQMPAPTIQ